MSLYYVWLFINPLNCLIVICLKSSFEDTLKNYKKDFYELLLLRADTTKIKEKIKLCEETIEELNKIEIGFINFKTIKIFWRVKWKIYYYGTLELIY